MNKSKYKEIMQVEKGIKKAITLEGKVKWIAVIDSGRQQRLDKKTGKMMYKQVKTEKQFNQLKEAQKAMRDAAELRDKFKKKGCNTSGITSTKFCDVTEDFKKSERYKDLDESYQDHFNNYINHLVDFLGSTEVKNISVVDIENYYRYQLDRGNLVSAKKNKDGTTNKKEGISVNTVNKHKTGAKKIWEFMIDAKVYGITENIVEKSKVPRVEVLIDGKVKKMQKIPFYPRTLTLEELNYTLNDALQNEFDRSVALFIGLAAIGSLRHSEIVGLQIGKARHDEYMNINDVIWNYSGYDKKFYQEHEEFIMVDTAIMKNKVKFPKYGIVRVIAKPNPLNEILEYAMEQRMQILDIIGKKLDSTDQVYMPLVNILKNVPLNSQKLGRKWNEYQDRRNKRMELEGLVPIPKIRLQDLRHTFSNLTKPITYEWERSYNMGHKVKGDNTTNRTYINDRIVNRDNIIKFFNDNIIIDWNKALHKNINDSGSKAYVNGSKAYVNGSGHLIVTDKAAEERKKQGRKFIFTEQEMIDLLGE